MKAMLILIGLLAFVGCKSMTNQEIQETWDWNENTWGGWTPILKSTNTTSNVTNMVPTNMVQK
jgi:hypothetical protein